MKAGFEADFTGGPNISKNVNPRLESSGRSGRPQNTGKILQKMAVGGFSPSPRLRRLTMSKANNSREHGAQPVNHEPDLPPGYQHIRSAINAIVNAPKKLEDALSE